MLAVNLPAYINPYADDSALFKTYERSAVLQILSLSAVSSRSIPAIFMRAHCTIHSQPVVTEKDNSKSFVNWIKDKGYTMVGTSKEPLAVDDNWQPVAYYDDDTVYAKDEDTAKAIIKQIGMKPLKDEDYTIIERLTWNHKEGEIDGCGFELDTSDVLTEQCLYPFIEDGPVKLIDDFIKSQAKILMFIGGPGTGKSSLVKYACSRFKNTSYGDDPLLFTEGVIAKTVENLLGTSKEDLIVFEEIDAVIGARKNERNVLIPGLLQATSGVITMPGKLIIVSNLESTKGIDEALVRSSRTFKVVNFRNHTVEEANVAAEFLGKAKPSGKTSYSLAEIMAGNNPVTIQGIGFTG